MATLELIKYTPVREVISGENIQWVADKMSAPIEDLPQLYWEDRTPWSEANHWALTKVTGTRGNGLKTAQSLMKHLAHYASWLEYEELDWRHFPVRFADRSIVKFRGHLVKERDELGMLRPSTTTSRMAAVIQFYRHAQANGFVDRGTPMWSDRRVLKPFYTTEGFSRTMLLVSSELAIPNRRVLGDVLEDGLMPLSPEHASELLGFTQLARGEELHLMLSLGILAGARFGTIATLGVRHIEDALPDESRPGFCRIQVGPGTGVKTKFDVSGALLVPTFLVEALKRYAYSMKRLRRQAKARPESKGCLFLTVRGNPYKHGAISQLMTKLRRRCLARGMRYMQSFKFHQTRCTYGTMLMSLALDVAPVAAAVAFVRDAMLHKDETTTMRYVKFTQRVPVKARMSEEFAEVFSGVINRDWNKFDA